MGSLGIEVVASESDNMKTLKRMGRSDIYVSIYVSIYLSIYLIFIYLSIYLHVQSIYLQSIYNLSTCIYLYIYL